MSERVLNPPREWFELDDNPDRASNYVDDHGRVCFLVCEWGVNHVAMKTSKWSAPRNTSGYKYAQQGMTMLDTGEMISTGVITSKGGHAPLDLPPQQAARFYDDPDNQVARGRYIEDDRGIWFCGALYPSVSDEDIARLRASRLSGDWRRIDNRWELVAACSVNEPGLPVGGAIAASGNAVYGIFEDDHTEDVMKPGSRNVSIVASGEIGIAGFGHTDQVPFSSVLVVEGVRTDDGRLISEGATEWRDLPLPLLANDKSDGHSGSTVIGRFERIERDGSIIRGHGVISAKDEFTNTILEKINDGDLSGISIDGVGAEAEFNEEDDLLVFSKITIGAATVVPIPAFADAKIELAKHDDEGDEDKDKLSAAYDDILLMGMAHYAHAHKQDSDS